MSRNFTAAQDICRTAILHVTGLLKLIAGYDIDFNLGFNLTDVSYTFDFLEADGGIMDFDPARFHISGTGSYGGYTARLMEMCVTTSSRCDLDLVFTRNASGTAPEPGTLLLMSLGLGWFGLAHLRNRRRDAKGLAPPMRAAA